MFSNFKELLDAAAAQDQPQRLLLLFAKAESSNQKKKKNKNKEQHGTLSAVMCVDKLPEEIASFQALVEEADSISKAWDFIIIVGLSGKDKAPPSSDEAEPYLNQLVNNLASGQDLSQYVIFDRQEAPVIIQTC